MYSWLFLTFRSWDASVTAASLVVGHRLVVLSLLLKETCGREWCLSKEVAWGTYSGMVPR